MASICEVCGAVDAPAEDAAAVGGHNGVDRLHVCPECVKERQGMEAVEAEELS
ncbi:hypothetical protein [Paenibacillus darwinianus]|uniref:hypothetical protein n=1 Tax=Paenibacillus darwinianus TaxID=1380763 RepID=UPI000B08BC24|nr:hypothetical protein [Paenibacillus darwinianus]